MEQDENGPKDVPPPYLPRKTTKNHETPHSGTQLRNPHSKKHLPHSSLQQWRTIDLPLHSVYKVVQIWPGLFVCKQVTVCPGHIWTTLYFGVLRFCVPSTWPHHLSRWDITFTVHVLCNVSLTSLFVLTLQGSPSLTCPYTFVTILLSLSAHACLLWPLSKFLNGIRVLYSFNLVFRGKNFHLKNFLSKLFFSPTSLYLTTVRCQVLLLHAITHNQTHTLDRNSPDEWSARRTPLPTQHARNTRDEHQCPPAGFEPAIPAIERPQTYALSHAATGIDAIETYG